MLPSSPSLLDVAAPLGVEDARDHIAGGALREGAPGTVGLELERHVVDVRRPERPVPWDRLTAALGGVRTPAGSRVTLEPGGQVELSTPPAPDVEGAVAALRRDAVAVDAALAADGLVLLGVGADPARPPRRVNPGARYAAMEAYFAAAGHGQDGAAMMCSTAALQLNVEAGPAHRWAERVGHLHRLAPALVALAACSPLLAGRRAGLRSARQGVWQRLDPGRCAAPGDWSDPSAAWATFAMAAPVMLVADGPDHRPRPVLERVPLADWVAGRCLLGGRRPTRGDVDLHLSTLWPPVRLRGWLELRLLDAVPSGWWPGLAAVVVAVLDDPIAADRAAEAAEPVAGRAADAARLGTTDPALARAARGVVTAALPAVPPGLRADAERWAALLEAGRSPADLVLDRAARSGPDACLLAEELR